MGDFQKNQEVIEQLKRSKQQQGYLETVKKDQYGNILSGRHRKAADPAWPIEVVQVKDDLDRELKIIHYNIQRRPTREETAQNLLRIAQILEKRGVEIAEVTSAIVKLVPYTERWVRELLPAKYKMTQMARERHEVEIQRDEWGRTQIFTCALCDNSTVKPIYYGDQPLCVACDLKVQQNPELLKPTKPKPSISTAVDKPKIIKPKETWEHRKAVMTAPISKMDEAMLVLLQKSKRVRELGYKVVFQKHYCTGGIISDVTLEKEDDELACFFDGAQVHAKRQERDEINRKKAATHNRIRALPLTYDKFTPKKAQQFLAQILEQIENK